MSILEQLADDIKGYAKEHITVEIVDLKPNNLYGEKWDVGDTGGFSVRVSNSGNMSVKNLQLHLRSPGGYGDLRYWSWIGHGSTNWTNGVVTVRLFGTLQAGASRLWSNFGFRTTRDTDHLERKVVEAHIAEYDLNMDELLVDGTGEEWAAQGFGEVEIFEL